MLYFIPLSSICVFFVLPGVSLSCVCFSTFNIEVFLIAVIIALSNNFMLFPDLKLFAYLPNYELFFGFLVCLIIEYHTFELYLGARLIGEDGNIL